MKRVFVILAILIALGGGYLGYVRFLAPVTSTPTPEAEADAGESLPTVVSTEGFVVPARWADLSFKVSGQVVDLFAKEGDVVGIGQVLGRLDNTDPLAAVSQAEDAVKQAEAGVDEANADVLQAESGVAQARAVVEVAKAAVLTARAELGQVKLGPTAEQIAQAEAAVQTARAHLNQTLAGARPEELDTQAAVVLKAEAALRLAQAEYDKIAWADNRGETPQALELERATLDYQAAKAQYEQLKNGPTAEEIAVASAGVSEAEAALAVIKAGPTAEAIAVAEAAVGEAEANVKQAEAGVPAAQALVVAAQAGLASAQAALDTAQTGLDTARQKLADYDMVAPLDGTLSQVRVRSGEFVAAGTPVMSVGDSSAWYVDTDDLSEIDVVQVAVGQQAVVTLDALPGEEFTGVLNKITPRSETKRGDVTYTVTIEIKDAENAPLRWGMTAFVDIQVND